MAGGRPTDYKPEYCDMVIEWLASGKLMYDFADKIGANIVTVHRWRKTNPEFCKAITEGEELKSYWGQKFVQEAVRDHTIQGVPFVMYCRNFLKLKTRDDNQDTEDLKKVIGDQVIKQFVLPRNNRDKALNEND